MDGPRFANMCGMMEMVLKMLIRACRVLKVQGYILDWIVPGHIAVWRLTAKTLVSSVGGYTLLVLIWI